MDLIRVVQTSQVTLSHTFYVDGDPMDPSGTVTVSVKRLDGTVVASGNASAGTPSDGKFDFLLPGSATQDLDSLTADWTGTLGGVPVTARDYVEIVGGFLFGIAEARGDARLADETKYPDAKLVSKRVETEQECERICRTAFVPRYTRVLLDGTGDYELITPDTDLRRLRSAKVATRAGGTFTALTTDQLAAVAPLSGGVLCRDDGSVWPRGRQNVLVEYEYGLDLPPRPIRTAAIRHLRYLLETEKTGIPDRAVSWTDPGNGAIYRITLPSEDKVGIPDVDAAYARYGAGGMGFA